MTIKLTFIFISLIFTTLHGQTALNNQGNIRIHEDGNIGFHTDFINNAIFNQNQGIAGFYGNKQLVISGNITPVFSDVELMNIQGVFLENSVSITSHLNFIQGNIISPKNQRSISFQFLNDAFYSGESDIKHINGFASISNKNNFYFPLGDQSFLRPIVINSNSNINWSQATYLKENPNRPSSISDTFSTDNKQLTIEAINNKEFWILKSDTSLNISLSWNSESNLVGLTENINNITIVGYHIRNNQWENLGAQSVTGNLEEGFISSDFFTPNQYGALGLGVLLKSINSLRLSDFFITPNGDGINDVLIIPETENSPNNILRIYNRYGVKVFEQKNYQNQFNGITNSNNLVINKDKGLARGVYFYSLTLLDLQKEYQGFLYLSK